MPDPTGGIVDGEEDSQVLSMGPPIDHFLAAKMAAIGQRSKVLIFGSRVELLSLAGN